MGQQRCTCYQTIQRLSRQGFTVEYRPSILDAEPDDLDVVCVDCTAVYRLTPAIPIAGTRCGQLAIA